MRTFMQYLQEVQLYNNGSKFVDFEDIKQRFQAWVEDGKNISSEIIFQKSLISLSQIKLNTPQSLNDVASRIDHILQLQVYKSESQTNWLTEGRKLISDMNKLRYSSVNRLSTTDEPYKAKIALKDKTDNYITDINYKDRNQPDHPLRRRTPEQTADINLQKKIIRLYKWVESQLTGHTGQYLLKAIEKDIYDYLNWQAALDYIEEEKGTDTKNLRRVLNQLLQER